MSNYSAIESNRIESHRVEQKENREEFREPSRRRRRGTEADLDPLGSCFPLSPEAINCVDSTSSRQTSSLFVSGRGRGVEILLPPKRTQTSPCLSPRGILTGLMLIPSKPNIICLTGTSCRFFLTLFDNSFKIITFFTTKDYHLKSNSLSR